MSNVICKCGHGIDDHYSKGCLHNEGTPEVCACDEFLDIRLIEAQKDSERWRARTEFLIERPDGFEWYKQDINCCIVVDPYDEDEHFCAMSWSEAIDQAIAAVEAGK